MALGFKGSESDFSLFFRNVDGILLLIPMYVDDILVTGDSCEQVLQGIQSLHSQFALKTMGEVHYFLGI